MQLSRPLGADAWPAKLEIGSLKAGSSDVLIETVTLVCERVERVL